MCIRDSRDAVYSLIADANMAAAAPGPEIRYDAEFVRRAKRISPARQRSLLRQGQERYAFSR